jgi:hypothetical protein
MPGCSGLPQTTRLSVLRGVTGCAATRKCRATEESAVLAIQENRQSTADTAAGFVGRRLAFDRGSDQSFRYRITMLFVGLAHPGTSFTD